MLSKNKIKFVQSLHLKKYRQKYNKIIVEGSKLCAEIIEHQLADVLEVYATSEFIKDYPKLQSYHTDVEVVTRAELKKVSALNSPSSVLIVCQRPETRKTASVDLMSHSLYLDGIRDPGNMGTIIRTADWFGMKTLLLSVDCVEVFSPKVIQASMGSVFRVDCKPITIDELNSFKNHFQLIGASMEGFDIYAYSFAERSIVVLGNEGQGMRSEIMEMIDQTISIPGGRKLGAESLNVGISAGIVMSEMARREKPGIGNRV